MHSVVLVREQRATDNQLHHLTGATENTLDSGVSVGTRHRVFPHVAVTAV